MSSLDDGIFDDPVEESAPRINVGRSLTTYTGLGRHRPSGLAATPQTTASSWDALFTPSSGASGKVPSWLSGTTWGPTEGNETEKTGGTPFPPTSKQVLGVSLGTVKKSAPPALGQSENPITLDDDRKLQTSISGAHALPGLQFGEPKIGLAGVIGEKMGRHHQRTGKLTDGNHLLDASSARKRPHCDNPFTRRREDEEEVEVIGVRSTPSVLNPMVRQQVPSHQVTTKHVQSPQHLAPKHVQPPQQVAPQHVQPPQQVAPQHVQPPQRVAPQHVQPPQQVAHQHVQPPQQVAPQHVQPPQQMAPQRVQPPQQVAPQHVQPPQQVAPQRIQPPQQVAPQHLQPPQQVTPKHVQPLQQQAAIPVQSPQQVAPNVSYASAATGLRPLTDSRPYSDAIRDQSELPWWQAPQSTSTIGTAAHAQDATKGKLLPLVPAPPAAASPASYQGLRGSTQSSHPTAASPSVAFQRVPHINQSQVRGVPAAAEGAQPGVVSGAAHQQRHYARQVENPNAARGPTSASTTPRPGAGFVGRERMVQQPGIQSVTGGGANQGITVSSIPIVQPTGNPDQLAQSNAHHISHQIPKNNATESRSATSAVPAGNLASQMSRTALAAVNVVPTSALAATKGGCGASPQNVRPVDGSSAQPTTTAAGVAPAPSQLSPPGPQASLTYPQALVAQGRTGAVLIAPRPTQNSGMVVNVATGGGSRTNPVVIVGGVANAPKAMVRGVGNVVDLSGSTQHHEAQGGRGENKAPCRTEGVAHSSLVSGVRIGATNATQAIQGPHVNSVSYRAPSHARNVTTTNTAHAETGNRGTPSQLSQVAGPASHNVSNPIQRRGAPLAGHPSGVSGPAVSQAPNITVATTAGSNLGGNKPPMPQPPPASQKVPNPLNWTGAEGGVLPTGVSRSTVSHPQNVAPSKTTGSEMAGSSSSSQLAQSLPATAWSVPNPLLQGGTTNVGVPNKVSYRVLPTTVAVGVSDQSKTSGSACSESSPEGAQKAASGVTHICHGSVATQQGNGIPSLASAHGIHAAAEKPKTSTVDDTKRGALERHSVPYRQRTSMLRESVVLFRNPQAPSDSTSVEAGKVCDAGENQSLPTSCKIPSEIDKNISGHDERTGAVPGASGAANSTSEASGSQLTLRIGTGMVFPAPANRPATTTTLVKKTPGAESLERTDLSSQVPASRTSPNIGVDAEGTLRRTDSPVTHTAKSIQSQASKPPAQLAPGKGSASGGVITHQLLLPKYVPSPPPISMAQMPTPNSPLQTAREEKSSASGGVPYVQPNPSAESVSQSARVAKTSEGTSSGACLPSHTLWAPAHSEASLGGDSKQRNPPNAGKSDFSSSKAVSDGGDTQENESKSSPEDSLASSTCLAKDQYRATAGVGTKRKLDVSATVEETVPTYRGDGEKWQDIESATKDTSPPSKGTRGNSLGSQALKLNNLLNASRSQEGRKLAESEKVDDGQDEDTREAVSNKRQKVGTKDSDASKEHHGSNSPETASAVATTKEVIPGRHENDSLCAATKRTTSDESHSPNPVSVQCELSAVDNVQHKPRTADPDVGTTTIVRSRLDDATPVNRHDGGSTRNEVLGGPKLSGTGQERVPDEMIQEKESTKAASPTGSEGKKPSCPNKRSLSAEVDSPESDCQLKRSKHVHPNSRGCPIGDGGAAETLRQLQAEQQRLEKELLHQPAADASHLAKKARRSYSDSGRDSAEKTVISPSGGGKQDIPVTVFERSAIAALQKPADGATVGEKPTDIRASQMGRRSEVVVRDHIEKKSGTTSLTGDSFSSTTTPTNYGGSPGLDGSFGDKNGADSGSGNSVAATAYNAVCEDVAKDGACRDALPAEHVTRTDAAATPDLSDGANSSETPSGPNKTNSTVRAMETSDKATTAPVSSDHGNSASAITPVDKTTTDNQVGALAVATTTYEKEWKVTSAEAKEDEFNKGEASERCEKVFAQPVRESHLEAESSRCSPWRDAESTGIQHERRENDAKFALRKETAKGITTTTTKEGEVDATLDIGEEGISIPANNTAAESDTGEDRASNDDARGEKRNIEAKSSDVVTKSGANDAIDYNADALRHAGEGREESGLEGFHESSTADNGIANSSDCVASRARSSFEEGEAVRQVVPSAFFESDDESLDGASSSHDDLLVIRSDEDAVAVAALMVDGTLLRSAFNACGVKIALQIEGSRECVSTAVDDTKRGLENDKGSSTKDSRVQRDGMDGDEVGGWTAEESDKILPLGIPGVPKKSLEVYATKAAVNSPASVGQDSVEVRPESVLNQKDVDGESPRHEVKPTTNHDGSSGPIPETTTSADAVIPNPEREIQQGRKTNRKRRQRRKISRKSGSANQPQNPTGKQGDATHFPRTLYRMLEEQTELRSELISWDPDGTSFTAMTTGEISDFFDVVKTYFPQWKHPRDAFHQQLRFRGFMREFVACEGKDDLGREKVRRRYRLEAFYRGMSVEELETNVLNVPAKKRPEWDGTRRPRKNTGGSSQVESDPDATEPEEESKEKPPPPPWKEPTFYSRALYRMIEEQTEKNCEFCFWNDDGKSFTTKTTGHCCEFFDIVRHYFPQWKSPRNSFFGQLRGRGFDRENLGSEFPNGEKSGARLEVRRFSHPHFYRGMSVEELDTNVVTVPPEERQEWDSGRKYYRAGETVPTNRVEKDETGVSKVLPTYFIRRVYQMLEEETNRKNKLMSWDPDGRSFYVVTAGHRSLVYGVVRRYFPHWKCPRNSFRDQLRLRGFLREVGKFEGTCKVGKGGGQPVTQRFRHPYFYRGVSGEELDRHISVVPKELRPVWFEAKTPRSGTLEDVLSSDRASCGMSVDGSHAGTEEFGYEDEHMEEETEEEEEEEEDEDDEERPEVKVTRRKPIRLAI